MPEPNDLAMVIMSGATPACSMANNLPVRPKPDWISSAIITIPCRVHASRIFRWKGAGIGTKPASPWTGSIRIAATASGSTWATNA